MNIEDILSIEDAGIAIGGANNRAVYRAIKRARADGHECCVEILGRFGVPKDKVEILKRYYYPYYSDAHQAMVKKWGASGGRAGAITKRSRRQSSSRGRSGREAGGRKAE
jgi:hypothetical protein